MVFGQLDDRGPTEANSSVQAIVELMYLYDK
jgi:hypothetical protein